MKSLMMFSALFFLFAYIATARDHKDRSETIIENGIKLHLSSGIKLIKAYLFYDFYDDFTKVSDSNIASVNQNVNMPVRIDRGGWVEKEGRVSIGASEKINTNTGLTILDEAGLFATLTDITAEDAQCITLKAVLLP